MMRTLAPALAFLCCCWNPGLWSQSLLGEWSRLGLGQGLGGGGAMEGGRSIAVRGVRLEFSRADMRAPSAVR